MTFPRPTSTVPARKRTDPVRTDSGGLEVHFSSKSNEWATPHWLFDALNREFSFTLDPCSTHDNAKCAKHFTAAENGLLQSWQDEVVFMNPPYGSQIGQWMAKAHHSACSNGATVVCLVPARTDTAWWHRYAMKHEIRLLRGRVKFGNGIHPAPFPSALVVMRPAAFGLRPWPVVPPDALPPPKPLRHLPSSDRKD